MVVLTIAVPCVAARQGSPHPGSLGSSQAREEATPAPQGSSAASKDGQDVLGALPERRDGSSAAPRGPSAAAKEASPAAQGSSAASKDAPPAHQGPPPAPGGGAAAASGAPAKTRASPASALYELGRAAMAAGRFESAARRFEQVLALDPGHGDARTALGWSRYRLGDYAGAAAVFDEATRREPARADAWTGLGYARLQAGAHEDAGRAFAKARSLSPDDADATKGTALLQVRTGRAREAVPLLEKLIARSPGDEDVRAALAQARAAAGLLADRRLRATEDRPESSATAAGALQVPVRAGSRYFEVRSGETWRPLLVKGVNLGVALPGRFPSEFPEDEALYQDWLGKIRAMHANVVRLYTLLPPVFYRVLAKENRAHAQEPLYLVQGVWVELPPDDDFSDPAWNADYAAEILRVIDAVHGNVEVAPRPGHASGRYESDVSAWLLAMILGREWEPYAVESYDARIRERARAKARTSADAAVTAATYEGRYVRVASGSPMECWIASTLETAAAHLARAYGESRPLAFTNWPTLDPLHHPTEASRREEDDILRKLGRERPPPKGVVYDNDAVSVDAESMAATPSWPAGFFASYHAYPYFPDFMILDPVYRAHRDREGPNAYAGYLEDLVRHHAGRPVLIAEVGVPTSRGMSHRQPQGFDHGGHDEKAQAEIDSRLVRAVHETGCAGAIVFAWLDEWFKRNWLVADLETPPERNPLWLNALDPEQHFGILAAAPGAVHSRIVVDGWTDDWTGIEPLYPRRNGWIRALYAASDEGYLFLRLDTTPSPPEEEEQAPRSPAWTYWIGIDTYDRERGDRRLPGLTGPLRIPSGLEFAIRLGGEFPAILVDAPYDIGSHRNTGPYASQASEAGRFIPMQVEIRMERIGRNGTIYPAEKHDLSPLRRGTTDRRSPRYDSLADVFSNPRNGVHEVRIPWNLLNVTDPSSRRVVHQTTSHLPPIDTVTTDGFVFYVAAVPAPASRPSDERPLVGEQAHLFMWKTWEVPSYHLYPKPVYLSLQKTFGSLDVLPER